MKLFNYIKLRVFCKEGESEEDIINKIKELFPFEKLVIDKKVNFGFEDKQIIVINTIIKRSKEVAGFTELFFSKFNQEQKELLLRQLDSRLDDHLNFYIRLDKDKLLNNEFFITDSGNCFHFKFNIGAFPHKREVAEDIIKEFLKV